MTTEHTDHTHTDPAEETPPKDPKQQEEPTQQDARPDEIRTTITFNGLLVFRPDLAGKTCSVGVLHTRDHAQPHILQIEIEPDPGTGTGKLILDPDLLERHVQNGNTTWKFEVAQGGQAVPAGIVVNTAIPADRHSPPPAGPNPIDFGWVVNLESGEFHSGPINRTTGKLKPVIELTKGQLFTTCLTDAVDVKQGPNTRVNFGFIAGGIGLTVKPADGDTAVLYFTNAQQVATVIFRLPNIDRVAYKVSIRNTPLAGSAGGHFHLFYDRLFQGVGGNQRFDLQACYPPISAQAARCSEGAGPEPDPFKCGGIAVGGSGPLE